MGIVSRWRTIAILCGLLLALGCEPAPAAPRATPVAPGAVVVPAGVEQPSTPPTPAYPRVRVGRLVLTTAIGPDEAPERELTTVPPNAEVVYLAVEVAEVPVGSRLTAVWLHDGSEFARSDRVVSEPLQGTRWFAFPLRPSSPLPGGDYAVRLFLEDQQLDSLVFRVSGRAAGTPSATEDTHIAFVTELPIDGGKVEPRALFPPDSTQVIAVLTDPPPVTDGALTSRWYFRGGILAEVPADELLTPSLRTFTLRSEQPLPSGPYRVDVLLDGQVIASGEFVVQAAPPPTTQATVEQLVVVATIDESTRAPSGATLRQVDAPATVYAAVLVRNLSPDDLLEIVWVRNDVEVARFPVTGLDLSYNWVSVPYQIPAQPDETTAVYRAIVVLNGTPVRDHAVEVR